MDPIRKLTEYFAEFPGIGPRQARRFVYHLLTRSDGYINDFIKQVSELKKSISSCSECFRFFTKTHNQEHTCSICRDTNRSIHELMIVSRDVDMENIEKSKSFRGKYFVLGGTIPILDKNPEERIRSRKLLERVDRDIKNGLQEIILALNLNPEGENTEHYLKGILSLRATEHNIKISILGRGLSTGSELEYSDSETIINALKNRF